MSGLEQYDAGYLNDFGGGNVAWWHDYMRSELDRAHDHYAQQYDQRIAELEARQVVPEWLTEKKPSDWFSDGDPSLPGLYWFTDGNRFSLISVAEIDGVLRWNHGRSAHHQYKFHPGHNSKWCGPLTPTPPAVQPVPELAAAVIAELRSDLRTVYEDDEADRWVARLERAQWPAQDVARDAERYRHAREHMSINWVEYYADGRKVECTGSLEAADTAIDAALAASK